MGLDEWVIRTLGMLGIINVFLAGSYFTFRGYVTKNMLTKYWRKTPASLELNGSRFRATLRWTHLGEEISAVDPNIFSFKKKDSTYIFVSPTGFEYKVDSFTTNGKGMILLGYLLIASSSVLLMFWL